MGQQPTATLQPPPGLQPTMVASAQQAPQPVDFAGLARGTGLVANAGFAPSGTGATAYRLQTMQTSGTTGLVPRQRIHVTASGQMQHHVSFFLYFWFYVLVTNSWWFQIGSGSFLVAAEISKQPTIVSTGTPQVPTMVPAVIIHFSFTVIKPKGFWVSGWQIHQRATDPGSDATATRRWQFPAPDTHDPCGAGYTGAGETSTRLNADFSPISRAQMSADLFTSLRNPTGCPCSNRNPTWPPGCPRRYCRRTVDCVLCG